MFFDHNFLWVFQASKIGSPELIVETAKSCGLGLAVKLHDGDPSDDGDTFTKPWADIYRLCTGAGVPLVAWGYCYGNKYSNLLKEADAVINILTSYSLVGYVIDAEKEWEVPQGRTWAESFGSRILNQVPSAKDRLAYTPFWNLRYGHQYYPADVFSTFCSAVMPQCYFDLAQRVTRESRETMFNEMVEDYKPLGLPIYPIGELSAGVNGVKDLLDFARDHDISAVSWWLLDGNLNSEALSFLKGLYENPLTARVEALEKLVKKLATDIQAQRDLVARVRSTLII